LVQYELTPFQLGLPDFSNGGIAVVNPDIRVPVWLRRIIEFPGRQVEAIPFYRSHRILKRRFFISDCRFPIKSEFALEEASRSAIGRAAPLRKAGVSEPRQFEEPTVGL
jgi:hypothetical protein